MGGYISNVSLGIFLSFAAVYILYLVGRACYNIFLHPLAKFPGPKLHGATYIPYYFNTILRGDPSALNKLHDTYGPVVRITPSELSFNTAGAFQDICGYRPGKRQVPKDPDFYNLGRTSVKSIMSCGDADHSRMRRLLAYAFSTAALNEQESLITPYIELLISRLKEQIHGPTKGKVDIVRWYNFATFDTVGDLCFGESFHALETGDYNFWISSIFKNVKLSRYFRTARAFPILGTPLFLLVKLFPKFVEARTKHIMYSVEKTEKRMNRTETDRKDFMTYILRHLNDEKGMTIPEIQNTSQLLIIGGSETTATFLSGATFHLLQNPTVLQKLTDDIRSRFVNPADMTFESVSNIPYMEAVIQETFRMYPPVPSTMPRRSLPEGDIIDGMYVPGNTTVGVNQWAIHHSERNFLDHDKFRPERWLGDPKYKDDKRESLQPFSMGPRNCIGKNLAYAELRSILARMVWHFDMELCPESNDWANQKVFILWDKPALNIRLTERVVT